MTQFPCNLCETETTVGATMRAKVKMVFYEGKEERKKKYGFRFRFGVKKFEAIAGVFCTLEDENGQCGDVVMWCVY